MSIEVTTYLGSNLGSPPHVRRREVTSNLKRGGKEGVSKTTCSVKEKINVNLSVWSEKGVENNNEIKVHT